MANPEHVAKLREGVEAWNEWRNTNLLLVPDLSSINLAGEDLRGANFRIANLAKTIFSTTNLIGADLVKANLTEANFDGARLDRALFGNSILVRGSLREAFIENANFVLADLTGADLTSSRAIHSDFSIANLSAATLKKTVLYDTLLFQTNFRAATLAEADIRWANFNLCFLDQTDFSQAICGWTTFGGVDLSASIGLEQMDHAGPSSLGLDTLSRSSGKIPKAFLRGCGLTDWEIAGTQLYDNALSQAEIVDVLYQTANLKQQPFQFYSCFVSYSTKDQDFADRLHADLQNSGVRCWFATHDIAGGKKIHEQIDEAIRLYDRLLLILSDNSMKSSWVETEISKARKRELREKRRMLFPVRLVGFDELQAWECFDADTGKDSAREIREYFIPDFSNWKNHESYKAALDRLIRDLAAKDLSAHA